MARQSSMTREEAESLLGPRGSLAVNSENRILVRKWLTASGLPSAYVGTLSIAELQRLYNDTTENDLNRVRQSHGGPGQGGDNKQTGEAGENLEAAEGESGLEGEEGAGAALESGKGEGDINAKIQKALASVVPAIAKAVGDTGMKKEDLQKLLEETARAASEKTAKEIAESLPVKKIEIKQGENTLKLPEGLFHFQFEEALRVVSAGIPLYLAGPAGSGKTTACEQIAKALETPFNMTGAVSGSHEFLGFIDGTGRYQSTAFRSAFEKGQLFLADEIDGSDSAGLLVINAALANGQMPFPDCPNAPLAKHAAFKMIAAANTFGRGADRLYVGRSQLDAATLDRFYFLSWEYDEALERIAAGGSVRPVHRPKPKATTMTADQWIDRVCKIRKAVADTKGRMVVSPRASIYGVKLLAAGLSVEQCEAGLVWRGVDADLRARVESNLKG